MSPHLKRAASGHLFRTSWKHLSEGCPPPPNPCNCGGITQLHLTFSGIQPCCYVCDGIDSARWLVGGQSGWVPINGGIQIGLLDIQIYNNDPPCAMTRRLDEGFEVSACLSCSGGLWTIGLTSGGTCEDEPGWPNAILFRGQTTQPLCSGTTIVQNSLTSGNCPQTASACGIGGHVVAYGGQVTVSI